MKEKKELRRRILELRAKLSPEKRRLFSQEARRNFLKAFMNEAQDFFLFASFGTEVDTYPLIGTLILSGKRVYLPKTYPSKRLLRFKRTYTLGELVPGAFGIKEPPEENPEGFPGARDIVVVPAVAVDRDGFRLGYGGGYYDRFLKGTEARKVALVFSLQVVSLVPREAHDVRVDYIVTEEGVKRVR